MYWLMWHKQAPLHCNHTSDCSVWTEWHGHWVVGMLPFLFICILLSYPIRASILWYSNCSILRYWKQYSTITPKFQYKFKANFFWQLLCNHIILWSLSPRNMCCCWKAGATEAGGDVWGTPYLVAAWVFLNMSQGWSQILQEKYLKTKNGLQTHGHSASDLAARI